MPSGSPARSGAPAPPGRPPAPPPPPGRARRAAPPFAAALERLRHAVQHSRVLQAEAREYGDAWLRNRIKVHVNVTNRVDASFWSGGLISCVFGYPDDVMMA